MCRRQDVRLASMGEFGGSASMPLKAIGLILLAGFLLGFAAVPLARILDPKEPVREFHPLKSTIEIPGTR